MRPDDGRSRPARREDLSATEVEVRVPKAVRSALTQMVAELAPAPEQLVLYVKLRDGDLDLRGFTAYLGLIDRVYGKLAYGSVRRYARHPEGHLLLSEIRRGSVVLAIREAAQGVHLPYALILVGLAAKYLPDIIRAPASAYREYQEARLARIQRKELELRLRSAPGFENTAGKTIQQIANVLIQILDRESSRLAGARHFSIEVVISVTIEADDKR